jgi:hypothetical protein
MLGFGAGMKGPPPVETEPLEPLDFAHPVNRAILDYFHHDSKWNAIEQRYDTRTHPDLAEILFELAPDPAVKKGYVYGRPVIANRHGLIFAWAGGTFDFFVRLNANDIVTACREGARQDSTYPPEWVNFYMVRLGSDWREIFRRWLTAGYEQASNSK